MVINAQNNNAIILKTTSYNIYDFDKAEWEGDNKAELLITIDLDDEIIQIDNGYKDVFYIRSISDTRINKDSDNDQYSAWDIQCYDKDGNKCDLTYRVYDEYNYQLLMISYSNVQYIYICKRLDSQ